MFETLKIPVVNGHVVQVCKAAVRDVLGESRACAAGKARSRLRRVLCCRAHAAGFSRAARKHSGRAGACVARREPARRWRAC